MRVLVDTDILSELQRNVNPNVRARARAYELAHGALTLSVLSVFEVLQGWLHRGRAERAETFLRWMAGAEVLAFDFESGIRCTDPVWSELARRRIVRACRRTRSGRRGWRRGEAAA